MSGELQRLGYSVRGLANWILNYADELGVKHTNMGINKLTFFALELVLKNFKVIITDAKIEAWEHGPVFREIFQSFKAFGNSYITGRARSFNRQTEQFEEAEIRLPEAYDRFLREKLLPLMYCSAGELRAQSHVVGGAWHRVWWYDGHANPGMEIRPDMLLDERRSAQP